jgi:hypothetical protein
VTRTRRSSGTGWRCQDTTTRSAYRHLSQRLSWPIAGGSRGPLERTSCRFLSTYPLWTLFCLYTNHCLISPETTGRPVRCSGWQMRRPIVLISGDMAWLDQYVQILRRRRMAAVGLADANAAAGLARSLSFGAIVVDVLDEADWNGCRRLKASPDTADVPLVAIAPGHDIRHIAHVARETGCSVCIPKPVAVAIVLEVLQRVGRCQSGAQRGNRSLAR